MSVLFASLCFRKLYLFFFTHTAPTEIYTLSLHDALPICEAGLFDPFCGGPFRGVPSDRQGSAVPHRLELRERPAIDRKSTRLNSSHSQISYAVFCLKKKKTQIAALTAGRTTRTLQARMAA